MEEESQELGNIQINPEGAQEVAEAEKSVLNVPPQRIVCQTRP